jgi:hypothetical protein
VENGPQSCKANGLSGWAASTSLRRSCHRYQGKGYTRLLSFSAPPYPMSEAGFLHPSFHRRVFVFLQEKTDLSWVAPRDSSPVPSDGEEFLFSGVIISAA